MRIVLGLLGVLLLLQVILHIITGVNSGEGSLPVIIGQTLDRDMVRLTAGLTAIAVSQLLGRQKMADKSK